MLSLSYGRIVPRDIASFDGLVPKSYETYQIVDPDDIVFRFTDLQNDKRSLRSARVVERGIITSAYVTVTPVGIDARYAEYLMRSYDLAKVFYGLGGGVRQSLKFSDVALLPVLLPPANVQRTIGNYLDRETQRIDALIAEQRGLIKTLRERRQSVLERTFTRDESPKRSVKLRRVLRKVKRPASTGGGVITAYRDGIVTLRSNRRVEGYTESISEAGYQEILPGDLVFHGLDGFAGAVGVSDSRGNATPVYHVCEALNDDNLEYLA
ncbi:MAG: hypothetical protein L0H03_18105, partial [Rhodococcus sp. (in: high G+C Gram-positive bacteria)]|nr:hypothetical protein [Rhodococcus sp. (in: high G+C Gram-positive bacteria)]